MTCLDCPGDTIGRAKRCVACLAARKKAAGAAWYEANREAVKARSREAISTPEGRAQNAARARVWRAQNPAKHLDNQRKYKRKQYGIINPTSETKFGACYTNGCDYVGPLHFDHWHQGPKKGEFRGWLCRRCNMVLGAMRDNLVLMQGLKDYVELAAGVGWPEETP